MRDKCYYAARVVQWVFGITAVVIPPLTKIPLDKVDKYVPILHAPLQYIDDQLWWMSPSAIIMASIATFIMKRLGAPWVWKLVHTLLDDFQSHVFNGVEGPFHHHRVTLFKRKKICFTQKTGRLLSRWPIQRWLSMVERSGHTTIKSKPCYAIPDNAERVEGIAGRAWAERGTVYEPDLPKLSKSSSDEQYEKYSKRTNVNARELKLKVLNGKLLARSFCAFPVEVHGERWGVIVIDSQNKDLIDSGAIKILFLPVGKCLSKLLERL